MSSWIKVRTNLHEDPRVLWLATELAVHVPHAVGMLVRLWSYADMHSTDGLLPLVSPKAVDELVGQGGFSAALQQLDWLQVSDNGVMLPRYGEHNGQTAKHRAQVARAVSNHRKRKAAGGNTERTPREEESREDKSVRAPRKGGKAWL